VHLLLTASYGGGSGGGGIVLFEAETLNTADNNEITIEVNAGDVENEDRAGIEGSDGKVYGIYQPSSQPGSSSHPTEEVRILFYFKCLSFCFCLRSPLISINFANIYIVFTRHQASPAPIQPKR
jgi:hypothetical protein